MGVRVAGLRLIGFEEWRTSGSGSTRRRVVSVVQVVVGFAMAIALRHTPWGFPLVAVVMGTDYLWACRHISRLPPPARSA